MKRRSRRIAASQGASQGVSQGKATSEGDLPPLENTFALASRRYSNSADIAIERPSLAYPMPKKSEGKILRPQYKDILKGLHSYRAQARASHAELIVDRV